MDPVDPVDPVMLLLEFLVGAYPIVQLYPYWIRHPLWRKVFGVKRK